MEQVFFEWKKYSGENDQLLFPVDAMEEIFLINIKEETIWFSRKCAELFAKNTGELKSSITREEFANYVSEKGYYAFGQAIQRLVSGKADKVSCHVDLKGDVKSISAVVYLYRLKGKEELFGHVSVDYEPMREYEQHLESVIQQLEHSQKVNELTLEGASDYVYQLDLVNNVCTFSSRALEVLPLESPTFSDAMNRVLSFIVPEDRHIFLDSFVPFLTGQSDRHVAEYRVNTKQGNIMWISCKGKGIHDDEGRPLMIAGSLLDITEQKKNQEKIEKMLYYDNLTGLKNKTCFEKDMEAVFEEQDGKGSLLYMNIHKFKLFNELFGHSFGNKVLKEFSYMLNLFFAGCKGIYRFSGDEFLVHLDETNRDMIMAKLVPFQANLRKPRTIDGRSIYINTYTAVVIYPEQGETVEELLNNAHQCLYRMTRAEREEISFFAGQVGDSVSKQFIIENEIRKDIEHGFRHFRVVYQPIVRLNPDGSEWIGAEALLRYSNPDLPGLQQMEMIQTLEYSGLILEVGRWVMAQAIQECAKWNRAGNKSLVHVNIAAQQVSDAGLVSFIKEKCEEENLPTKYLTVELTETSLLSNFEVATNFCKDLMKLGIGVALDDFGTGYSSFNYLRNLPISQIKIDRGYARQLPTNQYNQTFISFVHQLSKDLQLELCVEGVETEEELELLRKMKISVLQGFLFERPMEADVISREFPSKVHR